VLPQALATGRFVSTVTLMAPTGARSASGQPLPPPSGYADVSGLVDLQCMAAPLAQANIRATERRTLPDIMASEPLHILVAGYYPQVEGGNAEGWLAVVDGGASYWIVMGAESDSQGQMTRLEVKLVNT
jgi:hypothetical protein